MTTTEEIVTEAAARLLGTAEARAAERCAALRIPFALWAPPGDNLFTFLAPAPGFADDQLLEALEIPAWSGFFTTFFANDEDHTAGIGSIGDLSVVDAEGLLRHPVDAWPAMPEPEIAPVDKSTDRLVHIAHVNDIVARIKRGEGQKVVLSRLIAGTTAAPVTDIAARYFDLFPNTLRWLAYTPETGLWLGASPELVARHSYNDDNEGKLSIIDTMALAGTRPAGTPGPWDLKNRQEQQMVVDDIVESLHNLGAVSHVRETRNVAFGPIEHICNDIKAAFDGDIHPMHVVRALTPTAAICGHPRRWALSRVLLTETHARQCYGGTVGWADDDTIHAYANLRCAFLGQPREDGTRLYNVYAGGGITARSKAADEWDETQAKAAPLLNILDN